MKTKIFIRATLTVSVAVVMLALTLMPRTAAAAMMCVPGAGSSINCTVVPGNCSSWDETSGAPGPPWCFDAATAKASAEMLHKRNARMKEGGMNPQALQQAQKEFMKAFDMAIRAGVSTPNSGGGKPGISDQGAAGGLISYGTAPPPKDTAAKLPK